MTFIPLYLVLLHKCLYFEFCAKKYGSMSFLGIERLTSEYRVIVTTNYETLFPLVDVFLYVQVFRELTHKQ